MPMTYPYVAIPDGDVPRASAPIFQHLLDTYASETNKVISVWRVFSAADLPFRPYPRSSTVQDIFKHRLLSERRFFREFLGLPEPPPEQVPAVGQSPEEYVTRMRELAPPRLGALAGKGEGWWLEVVPFFDVRRERVWIFWRRVLHTAHHRTQLTVPKAPCRRRGPASARGRGNGGVEAVAQEQAPGSAAPRTVRLPLGIPGVRSWPICKRR